MRYLRYLVTIVALAIIYSVFSAQGVTPDPYQIYRFIKISDNSDATNVRWIEIWERRDGQNREWVMIDSDSDPTGGIASTCYYALAIGGGIPLYLIDDELQPTGNAEELFSEIENRRLIDNAENYIDTLENCETGEAGTVNGVASDLCTFEEDAFGLFQIRPPATARGDLWTATDGGYVVEYDFNASGPQMTVAHRYEFVPPPANFVIERQEVDAMLCFDDSLPVPDGSTLLTGSTTFSAYASELRPDEVRDFYDLTLIPEWDNDDVIRNGGRVYRKTLDDGTQCTLSLRFSEGVNATTTIAASVFPEIVNPDTIGVTEDFVSPVVVQSVYSLPLIPYDGTVTEAVANFTQDYASEGWTQRGDLTDIREDSAFIVLTQDDQETYITITAVTDSRSSVLIQNRSGICGSTFAVP